MNLALFPPLGGSLTALEQTGQLARFATSYLPLYAARFERVYYCSYRDERACDFPAAQLPARFQLLANEQTLPPHLYAWRMVRSQTGALATCHVSRVLQATGIVPAWLAKRRWGSPIAVTYGYHYAALAKREGQQARALYYAMLTRLTLRTADAIIVTTEGVARELGGSTAPGQVYLIPNGVNLRQFYPAERLPDGAPPTVLFVGRLSTEKDPITLLRAAYHLQQAGMPVRLALVGDGPLRKQVIQQGQQLGVDIHFYGTVSHDQLPELLRGGRAFVLPSFSEGHPKALLEAMACGLPVVVSDIPGNRSVVDPGANGLVFPVGDDGALAEQLSRALSDYELAEALGRAAHTTIECGYDLEALVGREVALLHDLALAKTRRSGDHAAT
jgi:glycosyltransferase involved in cell wall biosynthesis